ncbi:hypothetical protein [Streptomyces sp. NPDC001781]
MSSTPGLSSDQHTALEMLAEHNGEWTKTSGWHVGNVAKTARLLESLVPTGLVVRTSNGFGMTGQGFAAMEDHLNSLPLDEF